MKMCNNECETDLTPPPAQYLKTKMIKNNTCKLGCPIDLAEILASIATFNDISKSTFEDLLDIAKIRQYSKNSYLHYEGERVLSVDYLLHGCIKTYKINKYGNETILNLLLTSCIGETQAKMINYLNIIEDIHSDNCSFLVDSRILSFNAAKFRTIINNDNKLLHNILRKANHIIKQQYHNIALQICDAQTKLAHLLCDNPYIFDVANKRLIAQLLNITPETLSRSIKALADKNLIQTKENHIIIKDFDELQKLCHN